MSTEGPGSLLQTQLCRTTVFFHRSPEWRVKKGTFIWLQSATKSCTPDLLMIMLEAVVCAIVELYCVPLSGVIIILAIPFLINEGRLKSHGWHTYNFSNQDSFLATRWRKVQLPAVLLSLCILTTSKIRLEAIYRERKKRKAADKNTSCVYINSNNKTKRTNDAENDALILKSLTPPPYSLPQRSGLPGW